VRVTQLRTKTIGFTNAVKLQSVLVHHLSIAILAVAYGVILASLPLEAFKDRANYLVYAKDSWAILIRYWERGLLPTLANEPIWLLLNSGFAKWLAPENVVRLIIFIPASLIAWLVLRYGRRQFLWLLFFLLLPSVVKNHIVHLRQGVAIAVFMAGWMTTWRPGRIILLATTPFIHSSFFFILSLMTFTSMLRSFRISVGLRNVFVAIAGIVIGLRLEWLASLFGARQAMQYEFAATDVSGLGFAFWFLVLVVWCFQGRSFLDRHSFEVAAIVFYLSTYFFIEVSARIFESSLLLVLLAGLGLTGWRRQALLVMMLGYGVLQWVMRIGQPGLGFGIG